MSIKALISNSIAGLLIGAGGKNIKEWMEVSNTSIAISNLNDTYPGTDDRICTIIGKQHAIDYALAILWDANAILVRNNNDDKAFDWNVHASARKTTALDNIEINGTLVVPSEFAGAILGPGGSIIKAISDQSGARVSMNNKNASQSDRLVIISGTKGSVVSSTSLILAQLVESETSAPIQREEYSSSSSSAASASSASVLAVTLQIGIPDKLVGNIIGRNGSRLDNIKQETGADITVSGRNEYIEGTQNRLVTITGPTRKAYHAKKLMEELLVN
jgi:RNA-binding protein Nova